MDLILKELQSISAKQESLDKKVSLYLLEPPMQLNVAVAEDIMFKLHWPSYPQSLRCFLP